MDDVPENKTPEKSENIAEDSANSPAPNSELKKPTLRVSTPPPASAEPASNPKAASTAQPTKIAFTPATAAGEPNAPSKPSPVVPKAEGKPAPTPTERASAKRPVAAAPSEMDTAPSALAVSLDFIAAGVAIAFAVVLALDVAPFLK